MSPNFQEHLDRFVADFVATAARLQTDEELTIGLVRSALSKRAKEEESAYVDRCQRMLNTYSYVVKNAAAFRNVQALVDGKAGLKIERKLMAALYLFFMGNDFYLSKDPPLDLVLDALLKDGMK